MIEDKANQHTINKGNGKTKRTTPMCHKDKAKIEHVEPFVTTIT
jgi:hypothetical protein